MVTITNGVKTFRVTAGAVPVYKSMGFRPVKDGGKFEKTKKRPEHVDAVHEHVEADGDKHHTQAYEEGPEDVDSDAVFVEELLEKPLSQWSSEEVKDFVRIKGIDTSGVQKLSQVRAIIKNFLDEEQKSNA